MQILTENYIFSKDDYCLNLENWKREKGKNVLFITGLSGSGKTTLAKKMEKEYGAYMFELDGIERGYDSSGKGILNKLKKDFKRYNEIELACGSKYIELLSEMIKFIVDIMHKDYKNLYGIEGVQIFGIYTLKKLDFIDFNKEPLIIKNTSMTRSMINMLKRNGNGKIYIMKELKNHFIKKIGWYIEDEENLNNFKNIVNEKINDDINKYTKNFGRR